MIFGIGRGFERVDMEDFQNIEQALDIAKEDLKNYAHVMIIGINHNSSLTVISGDHSAMTTPVQVNIKTALQVASLEKIKSHLLGMPIDKSTTEIYTRH